MKHEIIVAPWTQEQVDALNRFQKERRMHPFTCGKGGENHLDGPDGQSKLVATTDGWVCPVCDYRQDWAHDFMFGIKSAEKPAEGA